MFQTTATRLRNPGRRPRGSPRRFSVSWLSKHSVSFCSGQGPATGRSLSALSAPGPGVGQENGSPQSTAARLGVRELSGSSGLGEDEELQPPRRLVPHRPGPAAGAPSSVVGVVSQTAVPGLLNAKWRTGYLGQSAAGLCHGDDGMSGTQTPPGGASLGGTVAGGPAPALAARRPLHASVSLSVRRGRSPLSAGLL